MPTTPIPSGFGGPFNPQVTHLQIPSVVHQSASEGQVRRMVCFEVSPMTYAMWNREINRRYFRRGKLFNQLYVTRVEGKPHGCDNREETFKFLWKH